MSARTLSEKINELNLNLHKCRLIVIGSRFYIRATFPPKPGECLPKQRRLNLDLVAIEENFLKVRFRCFEVDQELIEEKFDWCKYNPQSKKYADQLHQLNSPARKTCGYWIAEQERRYWAKHERTPRKEKTWKSSYTNFFRYLDPNEILCASYVSELIEKHSKPGSRKRQQMGICYSQLFRMAGLPNDEVYRVKDLCKGYKGRSFDPKRIPPDSQLLKYYEGIKRVDWQWAFGILLTYGIRPSELVVLDFSIIKTPPYILIVSSANKTKQQREVFPVLKNWPVDLNLIEPKMPVINVRHNQEANSRVGQALKRQNVFIQPTVLRDAYAIRCLMNGVPSEMASRWMGHSTVIHDEKYLDAIQIEHQRRAHSEMRNDPI